MAKLWRGHKNQLQPLSEAEAYTRCHGSRGDEVRIVKIEPRRPHYDLDPSGEHLREAFEKRMEKRDPAEEVESPPLEK